MNQASDIRIKFCGLTRLEDAVNAVDAGADLIGFNFYEKSPRYIEPTHCAHLVANLRDELSESMRRVQVVGVFVNMPPQKIKVVIEQCKLDLVQLSGDEQPLDLFELGERAFRAFRCVGPNMLDQISAVLPQRQNPPALLVDANTPGLYGGTGKVADWNQARTISKMYPILLAGGLNPSNVINAIEVVEPWGVDVASGIEKAPGEKDRDKMIEFVKAVRG